jgi:hypothetical protein
VFGKKDLRVELKAPEPAPERESAPERSARAERAEESPRRGREERRPREDVRTQRRTEREDDQPTKPGEWNGPVPSFLAQSAL